MVMRSSWIQTQGPQPNSTFKAGVAQWPSSSKAESMTIFTALLMVPEMERVKIYTDSQTCIDTFHKISSPHPKFTKKRLLKIKNWSIWTKIIELVQNKKLTVNLIKVKVHNGDFFNERADSLAKEALKLQPIEISSHETGSILSPQHGKMLLSIFQLEILSRIKIGLAISRNCRNWVATPFLLSCNWVATLFKIQNQLRHHF